MEIDILVSYQIHYFYVLRMINRKIKNCNKKLKIIKNIFQMKLKEHYKVQLTFTVCFILFVFNLMVVTLWWYDNMMGSKLVFKLLAELIPLKQLQIFKITFFFI